MNICEVYKKVQSSTQSEKVLLTSTNFVTKGVNFSSSTLSYKMGHLNEWVKSFCTRDEKKIHDPGHEAHGATLKVKGL